LASPVPVNALPRDGRRGLFPDVWPYPHLKVDQLTQKVYFSQSIGILGDRVTVNLCNDHHSLAHGGVLKAKVPVAENQQKRLAQQRLHRRCV
jgi:hypothetical protein